jgi:hypothetical protein
MCDLPKHREATFFRHAAYLAQKAGRSLQGGETKRSGIGMNPEVYARPTFDDPIAAPIAIKPAVGLLLLNC